MDCVSSGELLELPAFMILNVAFYKFASLSGLPELRQELRGRLREHHLKGTILISEEGFNASLAGAEEQVRGFLAWLHADARFGTFDVKESLSEKVPFLRTFVKIKKEIIPMGRPDIRPAEMTASRVLPRELKSWLDEGKDVVLLDTRNEYEIEHGTFKGARTLGLKHFREFGTKLGAVTPELRDKRVVMFCTGGIRCEKATALAIKENFKEVYQLEGGILRYFEECGSSHYEGTCFVFDERVALDSSLNHRQ
jgi:predicted sulfurtransferase